MPTTSTTNTNIARYLPLMAAERPNQVAVLRRSGRDASGQARYEQLSFAELNRSSDAYARGLTRYGIGAGTRVLLMVPPGLPLIALTFALLKTGCVPILIDPAMGRANLATCIAESQPEALIGVPAAHLARLLFRRACRTITRAVMVGQRRGWGIPTLDELHDDVPEPFALAPTQPDTMAAILFTSGSTGVPKGVVYEHGMFEAQVHALRALYQIAPGEVEMPAFPLFALFNVALGITSAIPEISPTRPASCDPATVVELIRDRQVTSSFGSPAIWNRVTRYCLDQQIRLPSLRRVLMAGAPVPLILHERFAQILAPEADTHTPYGATEALPVASASGRAILAAMRERADPTAGTCVGWPVPTVTLRIIPISDEPIAQWNDALALPPGSVGEIVVRGPMVTRAYVNRPQSNLLAKIADGDAVWHRMGDLGALDEQGRLWFYGRKSQRVQLASQCLYTEPCELVFSQHPAVYRAALVGITRGGHCAAAIVIEPQPGQMPRTTAAQARFTRELLALGAAHACTRPIQTVLFHPSFPVDIRHNAKIFREQLALWAQKHVK